MIITAFALALAATPVAETPKVAAESFRGGSLDSMNLKTLEPSWCQKGGEIEASTKDTAKTKPPVWKPKDNPEAGYYHTLSKQVAGCAVPVPVKGQPLLKTR